MAANACAGARGGIYKMDASRTERGMPPAAALLLLSPAAEQSEERGNTLTPAPGQPGHSPATPLGATRLCFFVSVHDA